MEKLVDMELRAPIISTNDFADYSLKRLSTYEKKRAAQKAKEDTAKAGRKKKRRTE
jgi:hypothetical protein